MLVDVVGVVGILNCFSTGSFCSSAISVASSLQPSPRSFSVVAAFVPITGEEEEDLSGFGGDWSGSSRGVGLFFRFMAAGLLTTPVWVDRGVIEHSLVLVHFVFNLCIAFNLYIPILVWCTFRTTPKVTQSIQPLNYSINYMLLNLHIDDTLHLLNEYHD